MLISNLHHLSHNVLLVVVVTIIFKFILDLRVLFKDVILQILLAQGEGVHFLLSSVNKLRLSVVANIVVTDVATFVNDKTDLVRLLRWVLRKQIEADSYLTLQNKVHLRDFVFFIVNYAFAGISKELSRFKVE